MFYSNFGRTKAKFLNGFLSTIQIFECGFWLAYKGSQISAFVKILAKLFGFLCSLISPHDLSELKHLDLFVSSQIIDC